MYPNRTLCDVLREIRKLDKTMNFSKLIELIDEADALLLNMLGGFLGDKD